MKQSIKLLAAALAIVAAASCSKNEISEVPAAAGMKNMTFTASLDESTKAVVGEDLKVNWTATDSIAVWDGTQYNVFRIVSGVGTTSAVFEGQVTEGASEYFAVSPYPAARGYDTELSQPIIAIISGQYPQPGCVDPEALVSIAKAEGGRLAFKNAVGLIKIHVADDTNTKVKIATNDFVGGTYFCDMDGNLTPNKGSNNLAIYPPTKEQAAITPGTYYLACHPVTINGMKMKYIDPTMMKVKTTEKTLTVKRSQITEIVGDESSWERNTGVEISTIAKTSSTITAKWTWNDYSNTDRAYKAALYKDASCTQLELAFDIDKSLYKSTKPAAFCFSGLEPSTKYYVKIFDTVSKTSTDPVEVMTDPAFHKTLPTEEPKSGDIILQEDFSELIYGCDVHNFSPGYTVTDDEDAYNKIPSIVKTTGENPSGYKVCAYNKTYYIGTVFTEAVKATRLKDWASYQYNNTAKKSRYLSLAGYINAGAEKYPTHIALPEMDCLKHNAKLEVSFKCVYWPASSGKIAVGTMEKGATIDMSSPKSGSNYRITKCTETQATSFEVTTSWETYTVEIDNVAPGSRVYIGGIDLTSRVLLDDIQIKVISY